MPDDPSLLIIACSCGQKMKVPAAAEGKIYKCVKCGEHLQVRAEDAQPGRSSAAGPVHEPMGELLIKQGLITQEQLQKALTAQHSGGGKTFEILIRQGALDKDALHNFLSRQPGVAAIDLSRFSVDRAILELIPKQLALNHLVLPIDRLGKLLTVAMACPLDSATIAEVESITGLRVKAMLCRLDDIHKAVAKYYPEEGDHEDTAKMYKKLLASIPAPARAEVGQDVQRLDNLQFAPDTLEAALTLSGRDSVRDWADIILRDPAFAALVLRHANLAAYALPGKASSVPMAAALLGANALERIVQDVEEARRAEAEVLVQLSLRGRRLGAFAADLAAASGKVSRAQAQTAGLLAEIGRYVHLQQAPERVAKLPKTIYGAALAEAELKEFSLDHAQAGAMLATAWRWPETLVAGLQHQLKPSGGGELAAVLHLAGLLAGASAEDAEKQLQAKETILAGLGLNPAKALEATERHLRTGLAA